MPSNAILRNQRALGGALGIGLLTIGLIYHFFPRVFHVNPDERPQRSVTAGMPDQSTAASVKSDAVNAEINAGPPLTLAPTAVIVARSGRKADLPAQLSADTPAVKLLLTRANKAMHDGQLVGDKGSAAALFAQALKQKPDSRRAVQGLFDVRAQVVAGIDQDIAVGDAEGAADQLAALRTLPNSSDDVALLQARLKILTKIRPMLAKAAGLLAQGKADQPAGASAWDIYRQVLAIDPQNPVADQGILQVQRAVLDRALAAVAQNNFADADKALTEAQSIRPGSQQMQDVSKRVGDMREQRASGMLAQAHSALDAGNIPMAKKLAEDARQVSPNLAALADFGVQITNAQLYASYKPGQLFSDSYVDMPGRTPAMVVVPTGTFQMGAQADESGGNESELPQHTVTFDKGFAMARSEVTVAQFREFIRASGYAADSVRLGGASVYDERSGSLHDDANATWQDDYSGRRATDDLPVVNVSWNDAMAYTAWLAQRTGKRYRLPSEAEYEYALRGGTTTPYWWGAGIPSAKVENLTGSGDHSTNGRRWEHAFRGYRDGYWGPAPVMSFAANPFGFYDIDGNVSEWVGDCWHDSYVHAPVDGSGWINPGCGAHVVRGGSWGSSPEQDRSAARQGANSDERSGRVGFRVIREL